MIDVTLPQRGRKGVLLGKGGCPRPHMGFTQDHTVSCGVRTQAKAQSLKYFIAIL